MKSPVCFLFLALLARAGAITPVEDYLQRQFDPVSGVLFGGESWKGTNGAGPAGGYLFRFEVPMGPQGSPVVFVTSSLFSQRNYSYWSAYQASGNAGVLLADDVALNHQVPSFYLANDAAGGPGILYELVAGKGVLGYQSFRYGGPGQWGRDYFEMPQIAAEETLEAGLGKTEVQRLIEQKKLGREFLPKVEKILLRQYLQNPRSAWRPFFASGGVNGQQTDPADEEAVSQGVEFTPEQAATLWKAMSPAPTAAAPATSSSVSKNGRLLAAAVLLALAAGLWFWKEKIKALGAGLTRKKSPVPPPAPPSS
jgi:hypothetical protein